MGNQNKKITLENLAEKIDQGFEKVDKRFEGIDKKFIQAEKHTDKKIDEKIDQLALAVKKGFDENTEQHHQFLDRFENLEIGQEDIILRLDKTAHHFEINDLNQRLKIVEMKLEIA